MNNLQYYVVAMVFCLFHLVSVASGDDKIVVMGVYKGECLERKCLSRSNIRQFIFKQAGYRVRISVIPQKRVLWAVNTGTVDMMVLDTASIKSKGLIRSRYADGYDRATVYYRPSGKWQPSFPPRPDFQNARGVSANFTRLKVAIGLNLSQLNNPAAGIKMLMANRADYEIAEFDFRRKSATDILMYVLYSYPEFVAFANTVPGRELEEIYSRGLKKLLKNRVKYTELYLENMPSKDRDIDQEALRFLFDEYSKNHPELFAGKAFSCGDTLCEHPAYGDSCCVQNTDVQRLIASKAGVCGMDFSPVMVEYQGLCFEENLTGPLDSDCPDIVNQFGELEPGCCATQLSSSRGFGSPVCGTKSRLLGCYSSSYKTLEIKNRPKGATLRDCDGNWIFDNTGR